jgi:hypothetical protein
MESCPKCDTQHVPTRHCTSGACGWFRCVNCRSYGTPERFTTYAPVVPLEQIYTLPSIAAEDRLPPLPPPSE